MPAIALLKFLPHAAAVLAAAGFVWAVYSWGVDAERARGIQAELEAARQQMAISQEVSRKDREVARANAAKMRALEEANSGLEEYLSGLKSAGDICLDEGDPSQLDHLWGGAGK